MRLRFRQQGGFGAFGGVDVQLDTTELPAETARTFEGLVARAQFFTREAAAAPAVPDARCYRIEVEDDQRRRVLSVCDPVEDDALADLIAALRRQARAHRSTR